MRQEAQLVTIDPVSLSRISGGAGGPDIKGQCGPPPPAGSSSNWNFKADVPLSKIPYVGKYLPDLHIGGEGQKTSDYKTCVDAVTKK